MIDSTTLYECAYLKKEGQNVKYEAPEMEILYLEAEDVITLSALTDSNGNNELTEHESDAGTGWD